LLKTLLQYRFVFLTHTAYPAELLYAVPSLLVAITKLQNFFRLHEMYIHEYRILICEPERKTLFRRSLRTRENNIKVDMKDKSARL
jgi:hypothetical protein